MILPSQDPPTDHGWGPDHLRLHRHLLRRPELLPCGAPLMLALSGGQDSMALAGLLMDLRRLHGWRLCCWHGDHRWRDQSGAEAAALRAWALGRGLRLRVDTAEVTPVGEAAARRWRYHRLGRAARQEGCGHVVTGHTASDRAETVLLNLARGSHRRGLASLRSLRTLEDGEEEGAADGQARLRLVRPLLIFSRADTVRICGTLGLPIWEDPSNGDPCFARNRLRAEVMPVLEALHPGASHRISAQAERLAEELEQAGELLDLALDPLQLDREEGPPALRRRPLMQLSPTSQGRMVQHWLERHWGRSLAAGDLSGVLASLARTGSRGRRALRGGWQLHWDPATLSLNRP